MGRGVHITKCFYLKIKSLYFQINYLLSYHSGVGKSEPKIKKLSFRKSNDKYLKWREKNYTEIVSISTI